MNWPILEKSGVVLGVLFAVRVFSSWRVSRKKKAAFGTPLVDAALLEAVFHARPQDGDDPALLAEVKETFALLNRRAYAEEFWGLHEQLAALNQTLGERQKATLRRALVRLVTANDRWLQLVGAKACAALGVHEAVLPLRGLLEMGDTQRFQASKTEYSAAETADLRFRRELEMALAALT